VKPDDWDEDAPMEIVDEEATKSEGWLDDEPEEIDNPEAAKPEDWDDDKDGKWEAPKIDNPKCEESPGCGEWKKPMKSNPAYKGKWHAPLIDNPNYKGIWKPQEILNLESNHGGLEFGAARVGEVGAPLAPGELCAPFGLMGFGDFYAFSSALGVRGLVTFGDSPLVGALLVKESGLISLVTLHRGSRIINWSRMKSNHNKYTFLISRLGSFVENPRGGVRAGEAFTAGSLILIPLEDFPAAFLAFFRGVGLATTFHLLVWVFKASALAPAGGSLTDSLLGDWVEMGWPESGYLLQTRG
jgi:hypothetical protein